MLTPPETSLPPHNRCPKYFRGSKNEIYTSRNSPLPGFLRKREHSKGLLERVPVVGAERVVLMKSRKICLELSTTMCEKPVSIAYV